MAAIGPTVCSGLETTGERSPHDRALHAMMFDPIRTRRGRIAHHP